MVLSESHKVRLEKLKETASLLDCNYSENDESIKLTLSKTNLQAV